MPIAIPHPQAPRTYNRLATLNNWKFLGTYIANRQRPNCKRQLPGVLNGLNSSYSDPHTEADCLLPAHNRTLNERQLLTVAPNLINDRKVVVS